jgi:cob(I)alamin adenosyltransferase
MVLSGFDIQAALRTYQEADQYDSTNKNTRLEIKEQVNSLKKLMRHYEQEVLISFEKQHYTLYQARVLLKLLEKRLVKSQKRNSQNRIVLRYRYEILDGAIANGMTVKINYEQVVKPLVDGIL